MPHSASNRPIWQHSGSGCKSPILPSPLRYPVLAPPPLGITRSLPNHSLHPTCGIRGTRNIIRDSIHILPDL